MIYSFKIQREALPHNMHNASKPPKPVEVNSFYKIYPNEFPYEISFFLFIFRNIRQIRQTKIESV